MVQEGGEDAFPISPPTAKELGRIPVPSSPDVDVYVALDDDVPTRFRHTLAPPSALGKHASSDDQSSDASKYPRLASDDRSSVILATSDAFDGQIEGAWDLDDAELFSGESILLTGDAAPTQSHARTAARTPAVLLQRLMEAILREDEEQLDTLLQCAEGERVLRPRTLQQLHSVLRRCARHSEGVSARGTARTDAPLHLLDLDTTQLGRLLDLLERTMRSALRAFAPNEALGESITVSIAGLLSAQCVLTILAYEHLPKFLLSEELVELCIATVKQPLDRLVVPLVEACASHAGPMATEAGSLGHDPLPEALQELDTHYQLVCATMVLLEHVLASTSVALSDTLIIVAVYLSLAPFFANAPEGPSIASNSVYGRPHVLRPLRLSGLSILRSVFAQYSAQRTWVLSELLVSLLRLPDLRRRAREFRLTSGKKIYSITALLLQLLHAASREPPASRERIQAWVDKESAVDAPDPETNQADVHTLASTIAVFLAQKAAEAKVVKNSHDLSYASVVYALVEDLLTLVFLPDWPAAALLLACLCRTFVTAVFDAKSGVDAKAIALDHLGVVAARIQVAHDQIHTRRRRAPLLRSLPQICADRDMDALRNREQAVFGVAHRLHKHFEAGSEAAAAFHLAQLGHELVQGLRTLRSEEQTTDVPDAGRAALETALASAYARLRVPEEGARADALVVPQLVLTSTFFLDGKSLLAPLLHGAGAQALATRTRALRGLGNVAAVDAALLDDVRVRDVVLAHVTDTSASVRETAIAILGAYMLHSSEARATYHPLLVARAMDAAVGVRKRVLRLLRSLYVAHDAYEEKLAAVARMLRSVHDEDVAMQTLATQTLTQLWFPECAEYSDDTIGVVEPVEVVARMLADVGAQVRERPSPLEAFVRRLEVDHRAVRERFGVLVDQLLTKLFDEDEAASTAVLDRLRIVRLLVAVHPGVLTVRRAMQLLPYVNGIESAEDVAILEEVLRIYLSTLPHMPRTALAFAQALEQSLTPLVSRCTLRPDAPALDALVACFCAVIEYQTHHVALLQRTLAACSARLSALAAQATESTPLDRAASLVMTMTGQLCRYGHPADDEIGSTFDALLTLHALPAFRCAALAALGPVLCARPGLFLDARIASTLDAAFADEASSETPIALRILLEYLETEAQQAQASRPAVAPASSMSPPSGQVVAELRGMTEDHADTGVASALVQRYAHHVLRATLDVQHPALQRIANEIVQLSVLQGLSHPIQCMPYLVALETTQDATLRRRALTLHRHLFMKHASLLGTQYSEPMRASFAFQVVQSRPARPLGYRLEDEPRALLQGWYAIVREQRSSRYGFLKALVRQMDMTDPLACSASDVALAAYAAENLATLEYKVLDEPLCVLHELHLLYAESGLQVLTHVERHLRQRGPSPLTDEEADSEVSDDTHEGQSDASYSAVGERTTLHLGSDDEQSLSDPSIALARSTQIVHVAQALRAHLKKMYKLSEAKCEKYAADPRPERAAPAHRALADPMHSVPVLPLVRVQTTAQAVHLLEELVDDAQDGTLELDS